jgi:fructokinase
MVTQIQTPTPQPTAGRWAQPTLTTLADEGQLWGFDLGGTKIEGVVLASVANPTVLVRDRVPTEAHRGYEHVLGQIERLIDHMAATVGHRPAKIGLGTPGTLVARTGLMKNSNATCLNGRPMKADLEQRLGMQVEIANDANCFALAETRLGVVKEQFPDAKVVFGIILGTGVGGGVVVNGQVLGGYHGIAGEWGHNILDAQQQGSCFCGKTGCNESIMAGPALERFYARQSGETRTLKDIVRRATEGTDPVAELTLQRLTDYFGQAVSVVVNILDPDVIVVGGGVGNIDRLYQAGVAAVAPHIVDRQFEAPIVKPRLGDSAGVFGAAFLVA